MSNDRPSNSVLSVASHKPRNALMNLNYVARLFFLPMVNDEFTFQRDHGIMGSGFPLYCRVNAIMNCSNSLKNSLSTFKLNINRIFFSFRVAIL